MVLCWIALPVFAFLSLFSVRYRKLAKESLKCLFHTATLQKCDSQLDEKIRSDISGKLMKFYPSIAKFFYNYYKLITFALLVIMLLSLYFSAAGIYNYIKYGSCNGPSDDGFCIFDPAGKNSATSKVYGLDEKEIILLTMSNDDPIMGNRNASLTIIEFGCYQCQYTKKAESIVQEVLDYYDGRVNLQFKYFEIPHHSLSYQTALAADCALEQDSGDGAKYLLYHKKLFENQEDINYASLADYAAESGLDIKNFTICLVAEKYKNEVRNDTLEGLQAGVEGTPTFFINGQKIVGSKPFKTFKAIINDELEKMNL